MPSVPSCSASVLLGVSLLIGNLPDAHACAVAYPEGQAVTLNSERVVIVWDPATKTEHFVREPNFEGTSKSFGFIVPTPTVPTVAKESPELLGRVVALVPPEQAPAAEAAPVEVLQRVQVDDVEVATLKATDSGALGEWLTKNGFAFRPSLRPWSERYLAKGWVLTAMRYARPNADAPNPPVTTPTVRLSFRTDEPFYPYSEPAEDNERPAQRKLDVYVVGPKAMRGYQGASPAGPAFSSASHVGAATLAEGLGNTDTWGFLPRSRAQWTVVRLTGGANQDRGDDLVFRAYDAAGESTAVAPGHASIAPKKKAPVFAFAVAALAVLLGLAFALRAERAPDS